MVVYTRPRQYRLHNPLCVNALQLGEAFTMVFLLGSHEGLEISMVVYVGLNHFLHPFTNFVQLHIEVCL